MRRPIPRTNDHQQAGDRHLLSEVWRRKTSSRTSPAARLARQTLTDAELERARNVGNNPPRDVDGNALAHCVPNERMPIAEDQGLVGASRGSRSDGEGDRRPRRSSVSDEKSSPGLHSSSLAPARVSCDDE